MFARIEGGRIVDRRPSPTGEGDWRPMSVEGRTEFDPSHYEGRVAIVIEPDKVRQVYSLVERNISVLKADLKARVSEAAEAERMRFVTPGSAKALSYQEKLAEARLVLEDSGTDAALVPILAAEAAARGITLAQAAALIHQTYLAFKAVEAQINAVETTAKLAISDASDAAAARAAYEAITWPTMQY